MDSNHDKVIQSLFYGFSEVIQPVAKNGYPRRNGLSVFQEYSSGCTEKGKKRISATYQSATKEILKEILKLHR
jgi:hypothetical protein